MATINLAPGTQYLASQRRRRRVLFSLSAALVIILVGSWGTLFTMQRSAQADLVQAQQDLAGLERKIAEAGSQVERITLFEDRLAAVNQLVARHLTVTPILQELERVVPPPTVLTNINMDSNRARIDVTGRTPNIDEVAQALASLATTQNRTTLFDRAELSSVTRNEKKTDDGVTTIVEYVFEAQLPFAKTALYAQGS